MISGFGGIFLRDCSESRQQSKKQSEAKAFTKKLHNKSLPTVFAESFHKQSSPFKKFSKKVFKQAHENYPNSEVFFLHEFMEDIPSKDFIPQHSILNSTDKDELLQHINIKNLKRIFSTDMMSRYFNAKVGDVFKIRRLNVTSGHGVDYRVVVPGKIDMLF